MRRVIVGPGGHGSTLHVRQGHTHLSNKQTQLSRRTMLGTVHAAGDNFYYQLGQEEGAATAVNVSPFFLPVPLPKLLSHDVDAAPTHRSDVRQLACGCHYTLALLGVCRCHTGCASPVTASP